jgi:hypothetical protein
VVANSNVSTVLPPSQFSKHQLPCQLYLGGMIADMSTQPDDTTPQPGLCLRLADVGLGGRAQPLGLPLFAVLGVGERTAEHVPLDSPHEPLHSGQAGGRHCRPFIRIFGSEFSEFYAYFCQSRLTCQSPSASSQEVRYFLSATDLSLFSFFLKVFLFSSFFKTFYAVKSLVSTSFPRDTTHPFTAINV